MNSRRLDKKVALVTGGAERVGSSIALALAEAGCDVAINHLDTPGSAQRTAAQVRAAGRRAAILQADVSDASEARRLVDLTLQDLGRLDFVIHNASSFVERPFADLTEADFEASIGVGLRGPLFLSQAAAAAMHPDGGKIIAIAGNSLYEAWPRYVTHALAKAGLARMMELLAVALSPEIQCLAISPGQVLSTDDASNDVLRHSRAERALVGEVEMPDGVRFRSGTPEDVAEMVVTLCRATHYLTGVVIPLDGGKSRY